MASRLTLTIVAIGSHSNENKKHDGRYSKNKRACCDKIVLRDCNRNSIAVFRGPAPALELIWDRSKSLGGLNKATVTLNQDYRRASGTGSFDRPYDLPSGLLDGTWTQKVIAPANRAEHTCPSPPRTAPAAPCRLRR